MGKPATAYFCGNGHLLEDNPHHCFGDYDMMNEDEEGSPVCPTCGDKTILVTSEWGDETYPQEVPHEPISHDEKEKSDHKGNKYFVQIPVYDISRLIKQRKGRF